MKRWSLCKYCHLDTHCENQDRERECWFERQPHYALYQDCCSLVKKLLQVKPELREWLEKNYGEYL